MPDVFVELVSARVVLAGSLWEEGVAVAGGRTLPFLVERSWSGPSGNYIEQWSIRSGSGEVVHSSQPRHVFVRGLQSVTKYVDRVDDPIELEPGVYRLLFVIEGYFMGSVDIEVSAAGGAAA